MSLRALLSLTVALVACAPAPISAPSPARLEVSVVPVVASSAAAREAAAPPKPRSPWAYANVDPADDLVVGPPDVRASCEEDLARAQVVFRPASLPSFVQKKSKITCGAPQVVTYRGGPEKIAWSPSVLLTCTMALALARFEAILQQEAQRTFGKRVTRIRHLGTYACREMVAYPGWVSEHSYANAIDLAELTLEDGTTISVLDHFAPKTAEATSKRGAFLRAIARRAFDEEVFSSVLTPFFNGAHANHFHLDLARFQSDGARFGE